MSEERKDAVSASQPGATEPGVGQSATAAALEAGGQNLPAGPMGRTELQVVDVRRGMFGSNGPGDTSGYGGLVRTVALPPPSERPYGGWYDEVVDVLTELLAAQGLNPETVIEQVVVDRDELTLYIAREHIRTVCQHMRDDQDLRFELCLGVSGVHFPHHAARELHAAYHLVSLTHARQVRLEVTCPDADPHIPSVVSVYPGNNWHERETWDMFGIVFDGHPTLARTANPDDWVGHPQRKDYPLGGIPVEYKGATIPPADTRRSYS